MRRAHALLVVVVLGGSAAIVLTWAGCDAPNEPAPSDPLPPSKPPADRTVEGVPTPRPPRSSGRKDPPVEPTPTDPPAPAPAKPAARETTAPGELPEDELGAGDCVLRLQLVDAETGSPVESAVRVWRLGLPAVAAWTAGDQVQRKIDVPDTGAVLSGLPAGRYRIEVDAARETADDPPEFHLDGDSRQVVVVARPRPVPIRCVVLDPTGAQITNGIHRAGFAGWGALRPRPAPRWSSPRASAEPVAHPPGVGGARNLSNPDLALHEIVAGPRGFEVGDVMESTRVTVYDASHELRFDGRNLVRLAATGWDAARGDYVAVSAPLADLSAHVRFPNGTSALEGGATVRAECAAVLRTSDSPRNLWRTIPVTVDVTAPGYLPLHFEWSVGDPPRASVRLVPAPAAPPK